MQFDYQNKSRKRSHSDTPEAQRAYKKPILTNTSTSKSATSSPDSTVGDREIARDKFFGDSPIGSETTELETPDSVCCTDSHRDAQNTLPALGDFRVESPNDLSPRIRESQQAFTIYTPAGISQRKYKGPSSLEAFAQWLHMDSHVLDKDLSEHFRQASQHCEQLDIPRSLSMPILCSKWTDYVDAYFQDVAPLFSVVGRENVIRAATYLSRFNTLEWRPICERPVMATVYACIALGARVKGYQEVAQMYIEAACSLTGYLASFPQLESAQALLLIAIEHRGRSKSGAAFNAVRQAVSILNSMGLHRTPSSGNDHLTVTDQQTDRRVWWTAYALEKTMALELGRPSSTQDCSFDQHIPNHSSIWKAFVELAKIQSRISEEYFDQTTWRCTLSVDTMLRMQDELDEALHCWSDSRCELLKPRPGQVSCPSGQLAFKTLLSFHFHHALITLHRTALIETCTSDSAVKKLSGKGNRQARRLERSQDVCVESARNILTEYLAFLKNGGFSPLITFDQPLLAVYVLTVWKLKRPKVWSKADSELLCSGIDAIEKGCRRVGMPDEFSSILTTFKRAAMADTNHELPDALCLPGHELLEHYKTQSSKEFSDAFDAATEEASSHLMVKKQVFLDLPIDNAWSTNMNDHSD